MPRQKVAREKSFDYARRIAIGIRAHIAVELPAFVLMMFWYWIIFIMGLIFSDPYVIYLSSIFMSLRIIHGILMRILTKNKFVFTDIITPLFSTYLPRSTCYLQ